MKRGSGSGSAKPGGSKLILLQEIRYRCFNSGKVRIFSIMEIIFALRGNFFGGSFPNRPRFFPPPGRFFSSFQGDFSGGCRFFRQQVRIFFIMEIFFVLRGNFFGGALFLKNRLVGLDFVHRWRYFPHCAMIFLSSLQGYFFLGLYGFFPKKVRNFSIMEIFSALR